MPFSKSISKIISTFFYVGYLPLMPGTFGSLAGLFLFYLIKDNIFIYALLTLFLIILGFLVSGRMEEITRKKDATCIVIDEVSGMLLGLLFLPYYNIEVVVIAFIFFRLLDTFKPFPCDRLQKLKGGVGVMFDDIAAAIYTNIILQVVLRLASFRAS